jgi:hypothetical protein
MKWRYRVVFLMAMGVLAACGDDTPATDKDMGGEADSGSDMIRCVAGEVFDVATGTCTPVFPEDDMPLDQPATDAGDDMDPVDPDMDMPPVDMGPDIDPSCDKDGDGDLTPECGGRDCDDNNPRRNSRNNEICDELDNDCDDAQEVNNGLDCTFIAHTRDALYSVDPFKKVATELGGLSELGSSGSLLDVDTHPDGTLYGVTATALYKKAPFGDWSKVGTGLGSGVDFRTAQVNGLAIDRNGVVFATGGSNLFRIGILTGKADKLGTLGAENISSGDCVVNKGNNFFMTVKNQGQPDRLIQVTYNPADDSVTTREVGSVGTAGVYGLTAAWGKLYGLAVGGELIEIDTATGAGSLIHKFSGRAWYGAASTPAR